MKIPHLAVISGLVLVLHAPFAFAGPIAISDYDGPRFPYSASFVSSASPVDVEPPYESYDRRYGFWLNGNGARQVSRFHGDPTDLQARYHAVASAVDPTLLYVHDYFGGGQGLVAIRYDGTDWQRIVEIPFRMPIGEYFSSFVTVIASPSGSDIVFFRPMLDSVAVVTDTDGDRVADKILDRDGNLYDDEFKFGEFSHHVVGSDGKLYGSRYNGRLPDGQPSFTIFTVLDTDGDLIPDTPAWPADPRGRIDTVGDVATGRGQVDTGADRIVVASASLPDILELDGDGFPVPASYRSAAVYSYDPGSRESAYSYEPQLLQHDGSMVTAWRYFSDYDRPETNNDGIYVLDDQDFDGTVTIRTGGASELQPALTKRMFDPEETPGTAVVPCLTELRAFAGGLQTITFADFGIWPDGRAFTFRQAGVDRTSVTVSLDGLLSFAGPVTASPSLAALAANPGLVAPAWSDQWDTSRVRVFAGCAPVQRRFADGSSAAALSFAIEWRGLVSPNGKRTSLRCLLLDDGSFRIDYGAMETGAMPVVVGYSTDGPGELVTDDLSDNSWGGQPAGTLDEPKLGEEFGAAKPFDLAHKWIRFAGYGELRGPRPELVDIVLKKGNRIQMNNAGSNIQPGATLVVDSTETFELAKSATGSKWTVTKKALSAPGAKSVESIWSDGAAHSVVVVNPDGGRSLATELR
ncbi:MAG: hypothetical protein IT175_07760 [Acidobacteria bacterium]|nr:hypothetical protein [Acidobacteriota bacterium]